MPDIPPPHLSSYEFDSLEELLTAVVETAETEREAIWKRARICAVAHSMYGDSTTGKLAETLSCSGQQVRRYQKLGYVFPDDLICYERPVNLYLEALKADDPIAAAQKALDEGWSPRELKEWLAGAQEDDAVTEVRELLFAETTFQSLQLQPGNPVGFRLKLPDEICVASASALGDLAMKADILSATVQVIVTGVFPKASTEEKETS